MLRILFQVKKIFPNKNHDYAFTNKQVLDIFGLKYSFFVATTQFPSSLRLFFQILTLNSRLSSKLTLTHESTPC